MKDGYFEYQVVNGMFSERGAVNTSRMAPRMSEHSREGSLPRFNYLKNLNPNTMSLREWDGEGTICQKQATLTFSGKVDEGKRFQVRAPKSKGK